MNKNLLKAESKNEKKGKEKKHIGRKESKKREKYL